MVTTTTPTTPTIASGAPAAPPKLMRLIRPILPPLLLAALLAIAYANTFSVPFMFDDEESLVHNRHIRSLWPLSHAISAPPQTTLAGRPVASLTFALNYAISGLHVWSYHALNLLLHLLAACTLLGLLRRTFNTPALRQRFAHLAEPLAFIIALLWAVHPLHTEAVTYIVQRTEVLVGLFLLLTLYAAARAHDSPRPRLWQLISIACCALGMASKEVMVAAPLLVVLYERAFQFPSWSWPQLLRRQWTFYLPLAATWIILALIIASGPRNASVGFNLGPSASDYATFQFWAVAHYLRLAIAPFGLCFDYGRSIHLTPAQLIPAILIILTLAAATLWAWWRRPTLAFAGLWIALILAPTSSIVPIATQVAAERRMYLPLAAVIALLVVGATLLLQNRARFLRPAGPALALLAALALTALTLARNHDYRSNVAIWSHTLASQPDNPRAHNNLARALVDAGHPLPLAKSHIQRALEIDPDFADAHGNLGSVLGRMGQPQQAAYHLSRAIMLKPHYIEAHFNLGFLLSGQGEPAQAIPYYLTVVQRMPDHLDARNNLGVAYAMTGQLALAADQFRHAIAINPNSGEAHGNLGKALVALGSTEQGIAHLRRAIALKPDLLAPYMDLAAALANTDRLDQAIAELRAAADLMPHIPQFQQVLDQLLQERPATPPAK